MAGTHFYIDALNLYYGAVKNTPYKWLDFEALARTLVPRDHIGLIRYFTAIVRPRYPAIGHMNGRTPTCVRSTRTRSLTSLEATSEPT